MPTYLHPGVYIEEIPSGVKPIEAVGTSTAAFIGYTTKGPVADPILISKWDTYEEVFGGIRDLGKDEEGDPMGCGVNSFFLNGGTKTYIVRIVADGTADCAEGFLINPANGDQLINFTAANPGEWGNDLVLKFEEKTDFPGLYNLRVGEEEDSEFKELEKFTDLTVADSEADDFIENKVNGFSQLIVVDVQDITPYLLGTSQSQDIVIDDFTVLNETGMTVTVDGTDRPVNFAAGTFTSPTNGTTLIEVAAAIQQLVRGAVTANPAIAQFTCEVEGNTLLLTSGTRLPTSSVVVTGPEEENAAAILTLGTAYDGIELDGEASLNAMLTSITGPEGVETIIMAGGINGDPPTIDEYEDVFSAFEKYRDINIICLPGQTWDTVPERSIIDGAVAHAEKMKSRMVIIDPSVGTELITEKDVTDLGLKPKTYSVLYYPWTKVANRYYDAEKRPGMPTTVLVAPSGFAAGMWAKIDSRRGVWKAPAGVETSLLGVADLQYKVEDIEQDSLNPYGVNCLRKMPGYGSVIWGTRTLATKADPEWRYIPVRRTAILIEQSIYNGIQWAVFEPNNHNLWASLRGNIGSFMDGLFRAGAFQGAKSSDAYFVRCGLGDTMNQDDIDRGWVIVIVGFAPLKPAEFVIVRIQQKVAQQ